MKHFVESPFPFLKQLSSPFDIRDDKSSSTTFDILDDSIPIVEGVSSNTFSWPEELSYEVFFSLARRPINTMTADLVAVSWHTSVLPLT